VEADAAGPRLQPEDECDLTVSGFCVFVDPPKPDAAEAVARLASAGVRVKILSGDGAAVVSHVAGALGMRRADRHRRRSRWS
jgi:Mg2+-importing ATPase